MPHRRLAIPFVEQFENNFCGPACAQMILLATNDVPDGSPEVQADLFDDIMDDTQPGFPRIENCGAHVLRWESYPDALMRTLNRRRPEEPPAFVVHVDANSQVSSARAVRGVNDQHASIALVEDATHWVVVYGWDHRQSRRRRNLPVIVVDGDRITDFYIRDPNWGYPTRIDVDYWTAIQYKVDCGTFDDQFVVVGHA